MQYEFTGMRRSGNHAIIRWFINNLKGSVVWHNNWLCPIRPSEHWYIDGKECKRPTTTDHVVMSVEDVPYAGECLILRDIYNLAASRIEKVESLPEKEKILLRVDEQFANLWLNHAWSYSSYTINYNVWAFYGEYRTKVLGDFGIIEKAGNRTVAAEPGIGSSFTDSNDPALLGDVCRRYEKVTLPKWLLDREDIRDVSKRLFGWALDGMGNVLHA